jgi:hypothetical protein
MALGVRAGWVMVKRGRLPGVVSGTHTSGLVR